MDRYKESDRASRGFASDAGRPKRWWDVRPIFEQRLRIGDLRTPFWVIALGFVITGLAAGQAVGPVFQSLAGIVSLTVERAVVIDGDYEIEDTSLSQGLTPFDAFVATTNDEGTGFTIAAETVAGQASEFNLPLENRTDQPVVMTLQLEYPAELDVEIDSDLDVRETKAGANAWLLEVGPANGNLYVTVEYKDPAHPGFIELSGRLFTVAP